MKAKIKEEDLASKVVQWLEAQHFDVYQEVMIESFGHCADIVAVLDDLIWVIECKVSLSFKLIEQADYWKNFSHYTSIAVPIRTINPIALEILKSKGIGILWIGSNDSLRQLEKPKLQRHRSYHWIRNSLNEGHKTFAKAGNAEGKRWTPFKQTVLNLERIVKASPGISMKEAIKKIEDHHYNQDKTAIGVLSRYIDKNIIKTIEKRRNGKRIELFYKDES